MIFSDLVRFVGNSMPKCILIFQTQIFSTIIASKQLKILMPSKLKTMPIKCVIFSYLMINFT